jgi:transposase InsO family protein
VERGVPSGPSNTPPDGVDWFNNRRIMEPIGNMSPAKAEAQYYAMPES